MTAQKPKNSATSKKKPATSKKGGGGKPVAVTIEGANQQKALPSLKKPHCTIFSKEIMGVSLTDVAMIASSLLPKVTNAHEAIYQAYDLLEIAASAHSAIERTANYGEGIHQHQKTEIQRIEFEAYQEELARGLPKDIAKDENEQAIRDERGAIKAVPWIEALSNLFGDDTPANKEKKFKAFVAARSDEAKAAENCEEWKDSGIPHNWYQDCRIFCKGVMKSQKSKVKANAGKAGGIKSGKSRRGDIPPKKTKKTDVELTPKQKKGTKDIEKTYL